MDEGYVKYHQDFREESILIKEDIRELNELRSRLFALELIGAYPDGIGFGNVSRRHPKGFIISGTQTGHINPLGPEHYALVTDYNIAENRLQSRGLCRASSEALTHAAVYELREDIEFVLHVHSEHLWSRHLHRLPTTRAEIPYGTPEMAGEVRRMYEECGLEGICCFAMAGHREGLVSFGNNGETALCRLLVL